MNLARLIASDIKCILRAEADQFEESRCGEGTFAPNASRQDKRDHLQRDSQTLLCEATVLVLHDLTGVQKPPPANSRQASRAHQYGSRQAQVKRLLFYVSGFSLSCAR